MTDHFLALAQPRRPWLDPAGVRESFQRAAARQHPDGGGEAGHFATLNSAHGVLRAPSSRLRHLIELAAPHLLQRSAPIPTELADLFMELATARRARESFVQKEAATASPLGRALLAGEKAGLRRDIESALARLSAAHETALAELRALDAAWPAPSDADWVRLAGLQAGFAFLEKWTAQLREDAFQMGG